MRWDLKWTEGQRKSFDASLNPKGSKDDPYPESIVPPPLTNAPELEDWLQIVYDGYFDLGRSGMGGPPAYSERVLWCERYGFMLMEDQEFIMKMWRKMGIIAAEIEEQKSKQKSKKQPRNSPVMGQGLAR